MFLFGREKMKNIFRQKFGTKINTINFDKINQDYGKKIGDEIEIPKIDINLELIYEEDEKYRNMSIFDMYQSILNDISINKTIIKDDIIYKLFFDLLVPHQDKIFKFDPYLKLYQYCNNKWYCPNLQFMNYLDYVENLDQFIPIFALDFEVEDKINIILQYILFKIHMRTYLDFNVSDINNDYTGIVKLQNKICIPYLINNKVYNLETQYLLKVNIINVNKLRPNIFKTEYEFFILDESIKPFIEFIQNMKTIEEFFNKLFESEYVNNFTECENKFRLNVKE